MYSRCSYTETESGSCSNQNLGNKYCFYHQGVMDGKFTPTEDKYDLSTLPSHSDGVETAPVD